MSREAISDIKFDFNQMLIFMSSLLPMDCNLIYVKGLYIKGV